MGCVVNGPGEARSADIGIAAGKEKGHLFIRGKIVRVVPEDEMVSALVEEAERLVAEGVEARLAAADAGAEAEAEADRQACSSARRATTPTPPRSVSSGSAASTARARRRRRRRRRSRTGRADRSPKGPSVRSPAMAPSEPRDEPTHPGRRARRRTAMAPPSPRPPVMVRGNRGPAARHHRRAGERRRGRGAAVLRRVTTGQTRGQGGTVKPRRPARTRTTEEPRPGPTGSVAKRTGSDAGTPGAGGTGRSGRTGRGTRGQARRGNGEGRRGNGSRRPTETAATTEPKDKIGDGDSGGGGGRPRSERRAGSRARQGGLTPGPRTSPAGTKRWWPGPRWPRTGRCAAPWSSGRGATRSGSGCKPPSTHGSRRRAPTTPTSLSSSPKRSCGWRPSTSRGSAPSWRW